MCLKSTFAKLQHSHNSNSRVFSADEEVTSIKTEQSNPFVLRSTIPNQAVLPAPPLPPPLPPPFSLSMNPLIPVASFPPVAESWNLQGSQDQTKDHCKQNPPTPPTLPHDNSPDLEDLKTEVRLYEDRINVSIEARFLE